MTTDLMFDIDVWLQLCISLVVLQQNIVSRIMTSWFKHPEFDYFHSYTKLHIWINAAEYLDCS